MMARFALIGLLVLAGCVSGPVRDAAITELESDLAALESQPDAKELIGLELAEARRAVRSTVPLRGDERRQQIYLARRELSTAEEKLRTARLREELEILEEAADETILQTSILEARRARAETEQLRRLTIAQEEQALRAQSEARAAREAEERAAREAQLAAQREAEARALAESQAREAELARREADLATQAASSLQRQLDYLARRESARGTVFTLGDVAFPSGSAALNVDAAGSLREVVALLEEEPARQVIIEGHTDSQGSADSNLALSQRRADAVRGALVDLGVDSSRIAAEGMGEDFPVADNTTADGRAANRRVEVVVLR